VYISFSTMSGLRADAADEEFGRLEDRACESRHSRNRAARNVYPCFELVPAPRLGRNEVLGAAWGTKVLRHAAKLSFPADRFAGSTD